MTYRGLYIADGQSDLPLAGHLEALARFHGADVSVTPFGADSLFGVGARVVDRLTAILREDPGFAVVFVHRDAEGSDPRPRYDEVEQAARKVEFSGPAVAVVPVRMTEAWLLLDEAAIRRTAGNPRGSMPLGLPKPHQVESVADPKEVLRHALVTACGLSGRRLKIFKRQFGTHRRLLLETLDLHGQVRRLTAWRRLVEDMGHACQHLGGR